MNKNKLRFKFYAICKKYNLNVNVRMKLNEIESILNDFFIINSAAKKIQNNFKYYLVKKNKNLFEKILKENESLKLKNEQLVIESLENNDIIDLKQQIFELKEKNKNLENKCNNYHSIISNYEKINRIINENNEIKDLYIGENIDTYNKITKWSITKMRNFLKEKNIITTNLSKHEMKQQINRLCNAKYKRASDKIIEISRLKYN